MKKILAILAATIVAFTASTFATGENNTGTVTPPPPVTTTPKDQAKAALNTCIKNAALTREGYLQSAYKDFSDAILIAYLKRSNDVKAAYETTTSLKDAKPLIRTAFDTWRETIKVARKAFQEKRKAVWTTFKNDVKACRPDKASSRDATQDASGQERNEGSSL